MLFLNSCTFTVQNNSEFKFSIAKLVLLLTLREQVLVLLTQPPSFNNLSVQYIKLCIQDKFKQNLEVNCGNYFIINC